MRLIAYSLFLVLYKTGITIVSPWNPKARLWVKGRKKLFKDIVANVSSKRSSELVWMHCASVGEFEQGRPVLEMIKSHYQHTFILVTFFSSSGYEATKNYKGANYICYLPMDSSANARRFLNIIQPKLVLWIKYEYWYYYLREIEKRKICLLLISSLFKREQVFFKWYGNLNREMLKCFTHLFVQNTDSKKLLAELGFSENVSISGDTRFDRVIEISEQFQPLALIEQFCGDCQVIVAGSTWEEDEEELDHFAKTNSSVKMIIAPHEINATHLKVMKRLFRHSILYSELKNESDNIKSEARQASPDLPSFNVLIIDNIGMLSRLYKYATITYVGGGFGEDGIHNVLEAAVFGKPVVFGPVYDKHVEAEELLECGGAFSVGNALELEEVFGVLLTSQDEQTKAGDASRRYVYAKKGAKEMIADYIIQKNILSG